MKASEKVLLVGELSGFHTALKHGLEELGCKVVTAGSGDGFKEIPVDINYYPSERFARSKLVYAFMKQFTVFGRLAGMKNHDIVQFISPALFRNSFIPYSIRYNRMVYRRIINSNGNSFLVSCGSDPVFHSIGKHKLEYNPLDEEEKSNPVRSKSASAHKSYLRWNLELAKMVDGVIPATYEYKVGYLTYSNSISLSEIIPMPVRCSDFEYQPNRSKNNKIVIFHGISRPGYKGTDKILEAMKRIQVRYPDQVVLDSCERLPLKYYLEKIRRCNVLIDQCNSYGYGMNALIALAMGKVVLSGARPEFLDAMNVADCPVVNIEPDSEHIYRRLENIISEKIGLEAHGENSRRYVEEHHDSVKVARQYMDYWRIRSK